MTLSREIFRQYDVRGIVGRDLTAETAYVLGRAYAAYLANGGASGPVVVGRDNRPSGGELRDALVRGLTECGVDVIDIGQVPTPLLYWSLNHLAVAGGIQVTGSHNPPEYNGFKLSLGTASIHGEQIQEIKRQISRTLGLDPLAFKGHRDISLKGVGARHIASIMQKPIRPIGE